MAPQLAVWFSFMVVKFPLTAKIEVAVLNSAGESLRCHFSGPHAVP
jgi:hypothetical protein